MLNGFGDRCSLYTYQKWDSYYRLEIPALTAGPWTRMRIRHWLARMERHGVTVDSTEHRGRLLSVFTIRAEAHVYHVRLLRPLHYLVIERAAREKARRLARERRQRRQGTR
jgi:hypothetical protein